MNTPRTPEPTDAQIRAAARDHGIPAERIRTMDALATGAGESGAAQDDLLRDYRDLTDVRLRGALEAEHGLYIAESSKTIVRALAAGHAPRSLLMSRAWFLRLAPQLAGPLAAEAPIILGAQDQVDALTGYHVHRGALASMRRPAPLTVASVVAGARRVVVVEDVVDHTNLGAIFRSAAGLGIDAVLLSPSCADPLYRRSIRVSMGTVFQVPWARFDAWPRGLRALRDEGFVIAGLALEEDSVSLRDFAATRPARAAIVMGTEGDGLRSTTLAETDTRVLIPMAHGVDSLNVAAATAVACYALQAD